MARARIGILAKGASSYSTKRIAEACRLRGHSVDVYDPTRFSLIVENASGEVRYKGRELTTLDAIIPRIGTSMTLVGTAIVRQLELRGVLVLNGSHAITVRGTSGPDGAYSGTLLFAGVPEPSTWLSMLGGLAVVGLQHRRRR